LSQPEFISLMEAWQIVQERSAIPGLEDRAAGNRAEAQLRDALHKGDIATLADLVRGRRGWGPSVKGEIRAPLGPPERGPVPPDLWKFGEVHFQASGAVVFETETEDLVYRSILLRRADVERLWPPDPAPTLDGQGFGAKIDESKVETPSEPVSQGQAGSPALKPAPRQEIGAAIKAAYDAADAAGEKPPNIRELPAAVLPGLEERGYRTSARLIQEVGGAHEFKRRRRQPGKTISSEQRAKQK
jgi:hypothetical protein